MKKFDDKRTPMLLCNPKTGKYIDMVPFWEMVNKEYGSVTILAEIIDNAIRHIALIGIPEDSPIAHVDYENILYNLFKIRDAFKEMVNFKEGGE